MASLADYQFAYSGYVSACCRWHRKGVIMMSLLSAIFGFISGIFAVAFSTPFGDLPFSFGHFFIGVPFGFLVITFVLRLFGGDDK